MSRKIYCLTALILGVLAAQLPAQAQFRANKTTLTTTQRGERVMTHTPNHTTDNETVWDKTKETTNDAWDATKEGTAKAWDKTKEVSQDAWDATKEGTAKAWDKTKEVSQDAWDATKEGTAKAWDKTKEVSQDAWDAVTGQDDTDDADRAADARMARRDNTNANIGSTNADLGSNRESTMGARTAADEQGRTATRGDNQ